MLYNLEEYTASILNISTLKTEALSSSETLLLACHCRAWYLNPGTFVWGTVCHFVVSKPACTFSSWPFLVNWEGYLLLQMVCGRNKESRNARAQKEWESRVMCIHVSQETRSYASLSCACLHISNLLLRLLRILHRPVVPCYPSFWAWMSLD